MTNRSSPSRDDLQRVPGVGPSISRDLRDLGVERVDDLRGRDPEDLYHALCGLRGARIDRCVLYVFRCAVYFASNASHDPDRLKWWNWTDERMQGTHGAGSPADGPSVRRASSS